MTKAAHTEGPWDYERPERDAMSGGEHTTISENFLLIFLSENDDNLHGNDYIEVHGPNQEPNARLIAAAPDLLEALKQLQGVTSSMKWGQPWPGRHHAIEDMVAAAIAKAEGK